MGFSWQDSEKEYLHLTESSAWWENAENIFAQSYISIGIENENAIKYSKEVRDELTKVDEFKLYDDSLEALSYFKDRGYKNIIILRKYG